MEEVNQKKKVLYSAVQPSGNLTIGNYLGAIKNWVNLQDDYDCFYAMADMHAITVRQNPATLWRQSRKMYVIRAVHRALPRGTYVGFEHVYLRRGNGTYDAV